MLTRHKVSIMFSPDCACRTLLKMRNLITRRGSHGSVTVLEISIIIIVSPKLPATRAPCSAQMAMSLITLEGPQLTQAMFGLFTINSPSPLGTFSFERASPISDSESLERCRPVSVLEMVRLLSLRNKLKVWCSNMARPTERYRIERMICPEMTMSFHLNSSKMISTYHTVLKSFLYSSCCHDTR